MMSTRFNLLIIGPKNMQTVNGENTLLRAHIAETTKYNENQNNISHVVFRLNAENTLLFLFFLWRHNFYEIG